MRNIMKRRDFIRTGAVAGAAALAGGLRGQRALDKGTPRLANPDLAVVTGADPFLAVNKGLEALGGIKKYVPAGSTVGLLINAPSWWKRPGSHTHPDLTLAVILAAFEAGAKEIHYLLDPLADYWKRSGRAAGHGKEIAAVKKCSGNYVEKEVARAKALKKTSIVREFLDCDVFINLPIIKHHVGVGMSGNLKNLMGVNTNASNQFFHAGSGAKGEYDDIPFLAQCVADLNTLRKPDLCVADAVEFLLTNGPAGPGQLSKLDKVILGTDPVAVDAYSAPFVDLKAPDVLMITRSAEAGVGRMDVAKLVVEQLTV
ncbi:MAG: hypothetical protein A2W03_13075 [Candidatus Aminicenantes bacterium RBG_16_63_16]|nr:MAG: hypothetical protein A2W03_13075 [Candidatus Aminicenantes bacterium RBG_16_63_16]